MSSLIASLIPNPRSRRTRATAAATSIGQGHVFGGLPRAFSATVDAHKWLYVPKPCSILLLHDLRRSSTRSRTTRCTCRTATSSTRRAPYHHLRNVSTIGVGGGRVDLRLPGAVRAPAAVARSPQRGRIVVQGDRGGARTGDADPRVQGRTRPVPDVPERPGRAHRDRQAPSPRSGTGSSTSRGRPRSRRPWRTRSSTTASRRSTSRSRTPKSPAELRRDAPLQQLCVLLELPIGDPGAEALELGHLDRLERVD